MNSNELLEKIENKEDFIIFLHELKEGFLKNPQAWENADLKNYLDGMEAFLIDSSDKSLHKIDFTPSWKLFAQILLAASIYE